MIIQKKRIRNIENYMKHLGDIKRFYVCVKRNVENEKVLREKEICLNLETGQMFVPSSVGPITHYNAEGKVVVNKELPKEPRIIEHDYHVIDWHGDHHYGTCYQTRMCYQRKKMLPPCDEIIVEESMFRSEVLDIEDLTRVKHIINIFLEIFGICEIVDEAMQPICTKAIKSLSWTILPHGEYPWDKVKPYLENYFNSISNGAKLTIEKRHRTIAEYNPDFVAIGGEGFKGYVIYGFQDKELFYFESNEPENATYIFKGNWESASKLTKREIIQARLCHKRLVHTKKWENSIAELMR